MTLRETTSALCHRLRPGPRGRRWLTSGFARLARKCDRRRWNAAGTDADLVPAAGAAVELEVADSTEPGGRREQTWRFPGRIECMVCHSRIPLEDALAGFDEGVCSYCTHIATKDD